MSTRCAPALSIPETVLLLSLDSEGRLPDNGILADGTWGHGLRGCVLCELCLRGRLARPEQNPRPALCGEHS